MPTGKMTGQARGSAWKAEAPIGWQEMLAVRWCWVGLQVFSQMTAVMESLLTNREGVASRRLVLLFGMFSDVMLLEVVSSPTALVAHSTQKTARFTMNGVSVPLQRFVGSEGLGANIAHCRLSVFLGRR